MDLLPKQYEAFWEAFAEVVEPDVADPVLALLRDPTPLVAELEACGTTLVHADIRDEQIGLQDDRLILLDWGRASQGHPVVDFFWSICHNAWRVDATHDELVEDFRRARGERDDPRAVELGVLGGLTMYGWVFGHSAAWHPDPAEREWARGELGWWVPQGAAGAGDLVTGLNALVPGQPGCEHVFALWSSASCLPASSWPSRPGAGERCCASRWRWPASRGARGRWGRPRRRRRPSACGRAWGWGRRWRAARR